MRKRKPTYEFTRVPISGDIHGCSIKEFIPDCPLDLIFPNPWNPNEQDDFQKAKTRQSLKNNGFVHNLVVREIWENGTFSHFQLLDGEHRTEGAQELGFKSAPCNNLGVLSDTKARKLSLILAANRGELNPTKLSKLISELETELDDTEFSEIPFDDEELEKLKSYYDVSWKEVDVSDIFKKTKEVTTKEKANESNLLRMGCLFPRHQKEKISAAIDRYALENGITASKPDEKRGKVISHILFNVVYPELSSTGRKKMKRSYEDDEV